MASNSDAINWSGGTPILGYEIDLPITKLVVNEPEANQVRAIFEMYLRRQTLGTVVEELRRLSCKRPDQLARPRAVAEPVMAGTDGGVGSVVTDGADMFILQVGNQGSC